MIQINNNGAEIRDFKFGDDLFAFDNINRKSFFLPYSITCIPTYNSQPYHFLALRCGTYSSPKSI